MSCQDAVYQWVEEVTVHFPGLSRSQARLLGYWSIGMVLARSCAVPAVSTMLSAVLGRSEGAWRQRLREAVYEAGAKRGRQRRELVVRSCFVPLLRWVLSRWAGRQLALAIDATSLSDRFVVLVVSVVYRGGAIPVSWAVLPAGQPQTWRPIWLRLLRELRPAVPRDWTVLVLADRGLYAPWLFRRIVRLGWHPFLRVTRAGSFRPATHHAFQAFTALAPRPGTHWQGRGIAFKTAGCSVSCTLLARWDDGYPAPWLILTDLPPDQSDACWYGLRAWIEQGFKVLKRGGWQWQRTQMTDPERAARLWLAVAVATLWVLQVGGEAEAGLPPSTIGDLTVVFGAPRRPRRATRLRLTSIFRLGWTRILAALLHHQPLPLGRFHPEPWPTTTPAARRAAA